MSYLFQQDKENTMFNFIKNWFRQRFMKDALIEALRRDMAATLASVDELHEINSLLAARCLEQAATIEDMDSAWWKAVDEEQGRQEAEERATEVQVNYDTVSTEEAIEDLDDIPF